MLSLVKIALIANRSFFFKKKKKKKKRPIRYQGYLLEKTLLAINVIFSKDSIDSEWVFFKTMSRSIYTSFMIKGGGQGVLKRKNYSPQVSVILFSEIPRETKLLHAISIALRHSRPRIHKIYKLLNMRVFLSSDFMKRMDKNKICQSI